MEGGSELILGVEGTRELKHLRGKTTRSSPPVDTASSSCRNVERILLAAQQQQLRQLRRLQQLKKHTERTAAQQAAWEAKELEKHLRSETRQADVAAETARKAAKAAEAEARRKAARQAAREQEESYRQQLSEKLDKARPRLDAAVIEYERRVSAARCAARIQRTLARKEQVLEEKRTAVLAAEEAAERRLQQKLELRLLQEAIKREEDSLAEERRREIQDRALADELAKVAYYEAKNRAQEQRLKERQEEDDLMRSLRVEESRAKFDNIRGRADAVNQQQEARRQALLKKLEDKLGRVEALAEERQAVQQHVKKILEAQELQIKQASDKMVASGKLELPPELLTTLTALENAVTSPYSPRAGVNSQHLNRSQACSPDSKTASVGNVSLVSPRCLVTSCEISSPPGMLPAAAMQLQRQQEAVLQRVLEEEILKEMARENTLQQISVAEERRKVLKQFVAERESAKARILEVGQQLLTLTKPVPGTLTGGISKMVADVEPAAGVD